VRPPARFGALELEDDRVQAFAEKSQASEGWISGGFFVFEPGIFNYVGSDDDSLESDVLELLAKQGELRAFKHAGFWQCMDTMRDLRYLEQLWHEHRAPWKLWM
jgi:glucose-1-phosphate cytidylyltransferase